MIDPAHSKHPILPDNPNRLVVWGQVRLMTSTTLGCQPSFWCLLFRDDIHHPGQCYQTAFAPCRFDFTGNGDSEGHFKFANYIGEVGDIQAAKSFLEQQEGQRVIALLGTRGKGEGQRWDREDKPYCAHQVLQVTSSRLQHGT